MLKIASFIQTSGYCGPAVLKMVMGYYGVNKSEQELAKLVPDIDKKGTTGEVILKIAKKFGFDGFIKDFATLDDIKHEITINRRPPIVDWFSVNDGHYSLAVALGTKNIYLRDPEYKSLRKLPRNEFFRVWFDFRGDFLKSKNDLIVRRMIVTYPKNGQ